jgi:hypothetical protein
MGIRIHELNDAAADSSNALSAEMLVEVSRPSFTVSITAATIAAAAESEGGAFEDSADGFVAAGFTEGDSVRVSGFTEAANNIFSGRITTLTAGYMHIAGSDGDGIVDEVEGDTVTITRWESRRVSAEDLADMAGSRDSVTALAISSGVVDIDCDDGDYFVLDLTENVSSITFSNLPAPGRGRSLMIEITQDSTARTVAWPASFTAAGGTLGSVSTSGGAVDLLAITTFDGGTTWRATLATDFS